MGFAETLRERGETITYAMALLYFAFEASWFALNIHPFVPPDEITHIGRILAFSGSWLPPDDGPATWEFGLISRLPPLYYYAMGRLAWLLGADLVTLRLCNVVLGVATVVAGIAWVRLCVEAPLARGLFAVMLTNTLMFPFLSGSVSYDNATNLLAACAIYYWFLYFGRRTRSSLLKLLACLTLGGLTKVTFLPLAAILAALFVYREWSDGSRGPADLMDRPTMGFAFSALFVIAALVANVGLYGGNLVRYGALRPAADQVIGLPAALQNRVFARDYAVRGYRGGDLSFEEASRVARAIDHAGDRANALALLRHSRDERGSAQEGAAPWIYPFIWSWQMLRGTVGVSGHAVVNKGPLALLGYVAMLAVAAVGWFRARRKGGLDVDSSWSLAIVAAYLLVLMFFVGYPAYRESGVSMAVHGRYAFVVLVPALGWLSTSLLQAFPKRVRLAVATAIGGYFVGHGLPWFVARATPPWFAGGG